MEIGSQYGYMIALLTDLVQLGRLSVALVSVR